MNLLNFKKKLINKVTLQLDTDNEDLISSDVDHLNGYLAFVDGQGGLVDEELECIHALPSFVKNKEDFLEFEKLMCEMQKIGFAAGQRSKQSEIRKALGL